MSVSLEKTPIVVRGIDWPTMALVVFTWLAWIALVYFHADIPGPVLVIMAGCILCLYGSLQHETIHGHPTPWRGLNAWLVITPLNVWMPYELYRSSHLKHHQIQALTHPGIDPESFYVDASTWQRSPRWWRWVLSVNQTLVGRLTIGPLLVVGQFYGSFIRGQFQRSQIVVMYQHLVIAACLLAVLDVVFDLNPLKYILFFVYPSVSLTLLRSFVEHQSETTGFDTTTIVENRSLLALCFLNNNFHWLHHRTPTTPWFELPALFDQLPTSERDKITVYASYRDVARRYLVRQRDNAWRK